MPSTATTTRKSPLRAVATPPVAAPALLTQLDDLILEEIEEGIESVGEVGATCLYAVYDPISGHCTMASAGHLAPVLVTPDGRACFLSVVRGPPLGVGGLPFEATDIRLPENSLLVLYTDGLVQNRYRDIDSGQRTLLETLTRAAPSPGATCDRIVEVLLPTRPDDDAALLVARTHIMAASHVASWNLPADPAVVATVRRRAARQLSIWGLRDATATAELIVSELVTNAIRYARPPIRLRLIHDSALICDVSDASDTSPHLRRARALDEGGRGLFLVGSSPNAGAPGTRPPARPSGPSSPRPRTPGSNRGALSHREPFSPATALAAVQANRRADHSTSAARRADPGVPA
ncbi:SpoIIE family protein phosphatase [Streptomyces malaysiensis]|uniref:SpoIIE family protein phosphatase n=1 Tax=Streptomyces malaysiensis TaxID=92644 RepID=UPI003719248C